MYLIYYTKDCEKGWFKAYDKAALEIWAENNLDIEAGDDFEIIDMERNDLQEELQKCKEKLRKIEELVK